VPSRRLLIFDGWVSLLKTASTCSQQPRLISRFGALQAFICVSHGNIFANIICAFSIRRLDRVIRTLPLTPPVLLPVPCRGPPGLLHSHLRGADAHSVSRAPFLGTILDDKVTKLLPNAAWKSARSEGIMCAYENESSVRCSNSHADLCRSVRCILLCWLDFRRRPGR